MNIYDHLDKFDLLELVKQLDEDFSEYTSQAGCDCCSGDDWVRCGGNCEQLIEEIVKRVEKERSCQYDH